MKCECGKEMKLVEENGDHLYYYFIYYCSGCDVFYKEVEKFVEEFSKITNEGEIEDITDSHEWLYQERTRRL
jgi:hypothetical protein